MQKNKTFSAILENIHRVRLNLPRKAKKTERIEAAEAIRQIISAINDETVDRDKGFLLNLKFYGLWIALQLDNHKVKVQTVNTRASSIETNFLYMLSATPIDKMSTDELKGIIMKTYSFYGSKNISKGIKAFTADLYDYQDDLFPSMKWDFKKLWADRSLNKESLITTKPFITFQHVRDALKEAAKMSPKLRREKIRLAIILGFFEGMRISEILHLDKYSLIYDGGHVLCVKTSKTKSGIRNIPLTLLMPGEYLKEVVAYFKNADDIQLHEHNGMAEALDYAIAEQDPFKESIDFSREVAKIFKRINLDVRFHHLRHSFANWFLIRWYVAMFGRKCIPDGADFLKEEVFSERYLQYLRFILFGFGEQKRGQNLFSHVMPVLARLIGHAGPDTTMVNYIHVADWIYNLLAHKNQKSPEMTLRSAEIKDFLQLSYPSLPDSLKKRATKTLSMDVLVAEQLRQLKKILKQS
jgi:integrase